MRWQQRVQSVAVLSRWILFQQLLDRRGAVGDKQVRMAALLLARLHNPDQRGQVGIVVLTVAEAPYRNRRPRESARGAKVLSTRAGGFG